MKKQNKQTPFVSEQAWIYWRFLFVEDFEVHIKLLSNHSHSSEDSEETTDCFRTARSLYICSNKSKNKQLLPYLRNWPTSPFRLFPSNLAWAWSLQAWPTCRHTWYPSQNQTTPALYLPAPLAPFYLCAKGGSRFLLFCLCSLVLTFRFWKTTLFRLYDSFAIPISLPSAHCLRDTSLPALCRELLILAHFSNIDLSKLPTVLDSAYYYTFTI